MANDKRLFKFVKPSARRRMEQFVKLYVMNGFDQLSAYKEIYTKANHKTARSNSANLLHNPVVQEEIEKAIAEHKISKSWLKSEHFKNYNDKKISERGKLSQLEKIGEMLGAYKKNDEVKETKVLNVTNVLNIIHNNGLDVAPSLLDQEVLQGKIA